VIGEETEEMKPHKFNTPAEDSGTEVFSLSELGALENSKSVHDAHATVQLPSRCIIFEVLRVKCQDVFTGRLQ
jgi:hypothetical protein